MLLFLHDYISLLVPAIGPANFTATFSTRLPTSIMLEWTAIPPEHQNGIIIGYVVTVVPSVGNTEPRELNLTSNLVIYEVMDLIPNTQYSVTIAAYTEEGPGPVSTTQVMLLPRGRD